MNFGIGGIEEILTFQNKSSTAITFLHTIMNVLPSNLLAECEEQFV